jgi:prepilin-type N-terminal cleavage/methylation domain-containing protein
MTGRAGYSLIEIVIALTLAGLLAAAAAALLHAQARLARNTATQSLAAEVMRTSAHVLASETRWSDPRRDVRALSADSLALRAFRASARVSRIEPNGMLLIELNGLRAPDPAKDSVLVLRDSTYEIGAQVIDASIATGCSPQPECFRVMLSQPALPGDLLLFFESGNYYLTARALRYRLGAEGRQPLTNEVLSDALTFFDPAAGSTSAWLRLPPRTTGAPPLRVRLPFLGQVE